jgi:FkbM family methyltransferase
MIVHGNFMSKLKEIIQVIKLAGEEAYKDEVHKDIKKVLTGIDRPIVFELGVNTATDTERLIDELKPSKYIGFECDPHYIAIIKEKQLPIQLVEAAVAARNGTTILYQSFIADEHAGSSSIRKPKNHLKEFTHVEFPNTTRVKTVSLDSFCAVEGIDHIDFIWVDIQGAEIDMIRGGQKTLSQTRYMLTEYSNNELYEGQVGQAQLLRALPGKWRVLKDYKSDVLLENLYYKGKR